MTVNQKAFRPLKQGVCINFIQNGALQIFKTDPMPYSPAHLSLGFKRQTIFMIKYLMFSLSKFRPIRVQLIENRAKDAFGLDPKSGLDKIRLDQRFFINTTKNII